MSVAIPASSKPRDSTGFVSAYDLFQQGHDTAEIAKMRWQSEASVLREMNVERAMRKGLPSPYREDRQ